MGKYADYIAKHSNILKNTLNNGSRRKSSGNTLTVVHMFEFTCLDAA